MDHRDSDDLCNQLVVQVHINNPLTSPVRQRGNLGQPTDARGCAFCAPGAADWLRNRQETVPPWDPR